MMFWFYTFAFYILQEKELIAWISACRVDPAKLLLNTMSFLAETVYHTLKNEMLQHVFRTEESSVNSNLSCRAWALTLQK